MSADVAGRSSTPFADATAWLEGAQRTLASAAPKVTLRLFPLLGAPPDDAHAPEPAPFRLATLEHGETIVLDDGASREVKNVEVVIEALTWGAYQAPAFDRCAARVQLALDDGTALIAAEVIGENEASARSRVEPFVEALERRLGKDRDRGASADGPADARASGPSPTHRLALRFEGEHLVLRDHDSRGPRENAGRYRVLALLALGLGVVAWATFVGEVRGNAGAAAIAGALAVAVVLSLAAFAMNEIARYAQKYVAESAPLAWFCDDRVVVMPWVSRRGAISIAPEGRYGAAIPIKEVNAVVVASRKHGHVVMLETEHGPMDVLVSADVEDARFWRDAVERALLSVAAPSRRAIALMRAQRQHGAA